MFSIRDERTEVTTADFEDAYDKIQRDDTESGMPVAFY